MSQELGFFQRFFSLSTIGPCRHPKPRKLKKNWLFKAIVVIRRGIYFSLKGPSTLPFSNVLGSLFFSNVK